MYTVVEVECFGSLWVVISESGLQMTRPCSWQTAIRRIKSWSLTSAEALQIECARLGVSVPRHPDFTVVEAASVYAQPEGEAV
jgi:hypothetical protein